MKRKSKVLLVLFILTILVFGSGITYSLFTSGSHLTMGNQDIAKFVFNTELVDSIELPLTSIAPGDSKEYEFSVSNTKKVSNVTVVSNVTLEYQITISTYHFMPLDINLYKVIDGEEELVLTCDETRSRNETNKLICNQEIETMSYSNYALDDYILKIDFPSVYNTEEYANLVDYLDLEISSWQKIEE